MVNYYYWLFTSRNNTYYIIETFPVINCYNTTTPCDILFPRFGHRFIAE